MKKNQAVIPLWEACPQVLYLNVWRKIFEVKKASYISRKYLQVGEMVFFWGVFVTPL